MGSSPCRNTLLDAESLYWQLIISGVGTVQACQEVGIGRKTGYRWRAENGGLPPVRLAEEVRSERYLSLLERQRIGDWEGDLIIDRSSRSAIGTLVDRSSRYQRLVHLPATTGMIQKRNSSIRWSRTSVSSKRLVPYLMRSLPGWSFSREIALDGSGPRRVAFHAVWVSDRDATYLGMALMRSM